MKRDIILDTYNKLDVEERADISLLANRLVAGIKARSSKSQFNQEMALETLGAIGMELAGGLPDYHCPICGTIMYDINECICGYGGEK